MPTTTTQRIFNFSAGPAVLPAQVLEEAQRDLVSLPGVGMSILEISHRSKAFEEILARAAKRTCARSRGIPDDYKVLFLQGGASLQFSMVPMNLLPAGGSADYIVTGAWSQKAVKEAKRVGGGEDRRAPPRPTTSTRVPTQDELTLDPRRGLRPHHDEQHDLRHASGRRCPTPATCRSCRDTSSDIFSRPDRRREVRADLRRRAEEPRPLRA